MTDKPTLHEIAAMPYPQSLQAMRKHYNPKWGAEIPDGVLKPKKFSVEVEYALHTYNDEVITVEAFTAEEAEELAADKVVEDLGLGPLDDIDVTHCRAQEVPE